jgi:CRP/FNR family cyclic AMP-dependent transcriptional regulator
MTRHRKAKILGRFGLEGYIRRFHGSKRELVIRKNRSFFSQGAPATHVFYIRSGTVKLFVRSKQRKEAVVALLGAGDLFGEGCVSGHSRQLANAVAITDCVVFKLHRTQMHSALREDRRFADFFVSYLLRRNRAVEENIVDLMFNSTEKRLARALLHLARFGKRGGPLAHIPKVNQDTLAALIGSTRTQVSPLMHRFRKLGFVVYDGGIEVRNSLLTVLLQD